VTRRIDGLGAGGISLKLKLKFIFKIVGAASSQISAVRGIRECCFGGDPSLRLKYGCAQDDTAGMAGNL
jgi:hypothetical protein